MINVLTNQNNSQIQIDKSGNLGFGISYLINPDSYYYKNYLEFINAFNSGNKIIDEAFREIHRHKECTNFVFFNDNNIPICFCSICCSSLTIDEDGSSQLEPAIEFRYFGVDKSYQNKKIENSNLTISSYIFTKCIEFAFEVAKNICGSSYCTLNAVDEVKVRRFYKKHGFIETDEKIKLAVADNLPDLIPAFLKIT